MQLLTIWGYIQEILPENAGVFGKAKAQLKLQLARDMKVNKNNF